MKLRLLFSLSLLSYSEFLDTVVTDEDWVCDLNQRPTDLYTWGTAGLIVGTAFFSAFADWKGRRPAFFVSTVVVLAFQLAKIGLADDFAGYVAVKVIHCSCCFYSCNFGRI